MPGLDRTGPMGQGSKTGRRMGNCRTENESEGLGRGRGRWKGLGNPDTSIFARFGRRGRGRAGGGQGRQD